jgi:hypothetical protein
MVSIADEPFPDLWAVTRKQTVDLIAKSRFLVGRVSRRIQARPSHLAPLGQVWRTRPTKVVGQVCNLPKRGKMAGYKPAPRPNRTFVGCVLETRPTCAASTQLAHGWQSGPTVVSVLFYRWVHLAVRGPNVVDGTSAYGVEVGSCQMFCN